jgi:polyisoprenoid-binding protein YceI
MASLPENSIVSISQGLPSAGVWELEHNHSSVRFRITHHAVTTFRSGFTELRGTFDGDTATLTGSAKVESIQAFPPLRKRLAEADFFDVENHPEMTFASTSIEQSGNQVVVEGDLTIKGVTKPVRATGIVLGVAPVTHFPAKTTHEHVGVDLELTIDRRDFGVSYNNQLSNGLLNLGSHVTIEFALEFARTDPVSQ